MHALLPTAIYILLVIDSPIPHWPVTNPRWWLRPHLPIAKSFDILGSCFICRLSLFSLAAAIAPFLLCFPSLNPIALLSPFDSSPFIPLLLQSSPDLTPCRGIPSSQEQGDPPFAFLPCSSHYYIHHRPLFFLLLLLTPFPPKLSPRPNPAQTDRNHLIPTEPIQRLYRLFPADCLAYNYLIRRLLKEGLLRENKGPLRLWRCPITDRRACRLRWTKPAASR